jgi:hypothetical protein
MSHIHGEGRENTGGSIKKVESRLVVPHVTTNPIPDRGRNLGRKGHYGSDARGKKALLLTRKAGPSLLNMSDD